MSSKMILLAHISLLLALAACAGASSSAETQETAPKVGALAPDFTLTALRRQLAEALRPARFCCLSQLLGDQLPLLPL